MRDAAIVIRLFIDATDDLHIELDDVWLKIRQEPHSRVPCSKVIDGRSESKASVLAHDVGEQNGVFDSISLTHLKNEALCGKAIDAHRLPRRAYARLRCFDRVG